MTLRRRAGGWAILLLAVALAGCVQPVAVPGQAGSPGYSSPSDPRVVVALVDSGINPYHEAFRAEGLAMPERVLEASPTPVDLTFGGDYETNLEADAAFWDHLELGRLYWFRNTRVLGIALSDPALERPLIDDVHHGTQTSSAVLSVDPDAILVMVEADSRRVDSPPFLDFEFLSRSIAWAATQEWVDVISLSVGSPGGVPWEGSASIPESTLAAVESGKLVIAAAGNDGTPTLTDPFGGPPWVLKAGGVVPEQGGETSLASKAPDFVSDFIGTMACSDSVTAMCEFMGTSLSTPLVAGAYARAIHLLREAAGHDGGIAGGALVNTSLLWVTNADLREAFNRTATYWNTTDYDPQAPPLDGDPFLLPFRLTTPILPTPWVQMGWGYVGADLGEVVAQAILEGRVPEKDPSAVDYMEALDAARWAYWEQQ